MNILFHASFANQDEFLKSLRKKFFSHKIFTLDQNVPLDKIEVAPEYKQLQIREIKDSGGYHRRVLTPDMDVSGEVAEIQEKAEAQWTNEVKDKWSKMLEEQEAK